MCIVNLTPSAAAMPAAPAVATQRTPPASSGTATFRLEGITESLGSVTARRDLRAIFLGNRGPVMAAPPGTVMFEQAVDSPRSRAPEIATSAALIRLKRTLPEAHRGGERSSEAQEKPS
jgi:hypothetical protein